MGSRACLQSFVSNAIKPCRLLSARGLVQSSNSRKLTTRQVRTSWKKSMQNDPQSRAQYQCIAVSSLSSSCQSMNPLSVNEQPHINSTGRVLELSWRDGSTSRYHSIWLRNHCQCDICKQVHSGQKLIEQKDIQHPCEIKSTEIKDGTHLKIFWEDCDHEGIISLDFLQQNSYSKESLQASAQLRNFSFFEGPLQEFDFESISSSNESYFRWLKCLDNDGIALLTNVPCEEDQVIKVAELIAPVQKTLYGKVFGVKAMENPINIAYTTTKLGFHMDLVYYESAPGLQLLHCLRFDDSAEGGENMFLDVFHSVAQLRKHYPHHFDTLTRVPATFQKIHFERDNPAAYMYQRPHISVDPQGKVTAVHWSPPFEGPLRVNEEDVEPYYEAYKVFTDLLENSPVQVKHRLRKGECVIFNNKRILHARNAFTLNGGQRLMQGCYVNIDDFRNCVQVAHIQHQTGELTKRCGNQCWF